MGSPKSTPTSTNTQNAQLTTQNNDTALGDKQTQQTPQEEQPQTTTKKTYLAEGWEFFDAHRTNKNTTKTQAPPKK